MANILMVDDEAGLRALLKEELTDHGHRVEGVDDEEAMWRCLERFPADMILLDLQLQQKKGWEVLAEIRRAAPNLPVLIFTAYDSYAEDPRLAQANGYVVKNIESMTILKRTVDAVLSL